MPSSLRAAISAGPIVLAPGAYDGLTAHLVAQHGFPAVYMTGAGTSVAHGYPDYGLLTMTEMAANAARMSEAAGIPVIADADTGYGNELNVVRTVQAYARAGVAALHIEDQTFPKRCGHLAGKEITDRDAWLRKIRAAVAAGADVAFVEAPQTVEEIAEIPAAVGGPCLFNVVPGGRSPEVSVAELDSWGYRIAIFPALLLGPVVAACDQALGSLAHATPGSDGGASGRGSAAQEDEAGPAALFRRVGSDDWDRLRARYAALEGGAPSSARG